MRLLPRMRRVKDNDANINFTEIEHWAASIDTDISGNYASASHTHNYSSTSHTHRQPFVYPEDFGALGDGTTDDSDAIQDAIDSIPSGGTVFFGPKTYRVNYITCHGGVELVGSGLNTVLKLTDDADTDASVINFNYNIYFSAVKDMTLDGNKAENPNAYDGINISAGNRILIERVRIKNCKRHGVRISGDSTNYSIQNTLTNVAIDNCDDCGIYIGDYSTDTQFNNVDIGDCADKGMELHAGNSILANNLSVWGCPIGVYLFWNERSIFNGLRVEHAGTNSVELHSCRNVNFSGCKIYLGSEDSNGTYAGFYLAGDAGRNCEDITIVGSQVANRYDSDQIGYGVQDAGSGVDYITVVGNDLSACDYEYSLTGTHNFIDKQLTPLWYKGSEYAIDDCLALEASLGAPSTGTAPSRALYNGTGDTGDWALWSFPYNATRYLQSAVQLPHGYISDSPFYWHVHFIPAAAITNGQTVIFKAEITYASVGGVFTSEQTYTSTFTSSGTTAIDTHCMTTEVEIDPATLGGSGFILARIYRDTDDTSTADVFLLGSDYHIRKNRTGSKTSNPTT